jgi:hypothetical protein
LAALIVRNFGVFWEREYVKFGEKGPGNKGSLLGYRGSKGPNVDFALQRGIYILYEGSDINLHRVAYIGQTGKGNQRLLLRLRQHTKDHLWNRWERFSWVGLSAVGANGYLNHQEKAAVGNVEILTALDQLEATLMQFMEPLMNRQGPKWHGAQEYFQTHPDEA